MLGKIFHNIKISGISCAVPDNLVYTDEYIDYYGENVVDRFKKATGIESRYLSNGKQTISDLCYVAAINLLKKKGLTGDDIDALILITQTADYKIPSTAYVLHNRLNIKKDCLVFDINLGCSGFVNGLYVLSGLIESGTINRALLLVGDSDTNHQKSDDVSFTMMFGDAGSATIIEKGEGDVKGMIRSDGSGFKMLITPTPGSRFAHDENVPKRMEGDDVFLFSITQIPRLFNEFYKTFECNLDDFDYIILHQANKMIIDNIAKRLKASREKIAISIDKYGNTDGASIPVTIVDLCSKNKINNKINLITSGFGIGLSWGIVSFEIDGKDVLPIIVTNDYYLEGKNV